MTERDVYNALVGAGFNQAQAAGIMGNIQNESSFNPEAAARDSNGFFSYGLVQWNAATYPNAHTYVTGNVARDLATQIHAIVAAARNVNMGGSAAQVAGNWASQFERCVGCQPGGAQFIARQQNADRILAMAKSGHWPAGGGGIGGGGGGGGSGGGGAPAGVSSPGILQQIGNIWGNPVAFWESAVGGASQVTGIVTATEDIAQALAGISNMITTIISWIAWWFVPSHVVRVIAFLLGAPLVGFGIFNLTRTGQPYSIDAPGVGKVPMSGGNLAPAIGIAEVTLGAVLLFVAFHNLPATVTDLPSLITYLQSNVAPQKSGGGVPVI